MMTQSYTAAAALELPPLPGPTASPHLFALSGRIGRGRFSAYFALLLCVANALWWPLASVADARAYQIGATALVAAAIGAALVLARRRLQDVDREAWLAVFMLVPLVNVLMWMWLISEQGTQGDNRHGLPPAPHSRLVKIAAWLTPFIVVAMVLSFAIPAWQAHLAHAHQALPPF
jgi:uncharacterized membrane protein YhaH (DUF805 family)